MSKREVKICIKCNKEFLLIPQELNFYERKSLPMPKACLACRRERRKSLRNERKLYKRTCDKCKMELISTYSENSPFIVCCEECYLEGVG